MKKWLIVLCLLLGNFAWFRFAADCFDPHLAHSEYASETLLKEDASSGDCRIGVSETLKNTRRPVHDLGNPFVLPAVSFTGPLGRSVDRLVLQDQTHPGEIATPLLFLRAPPTLRN